MIAIFVGLASCETLDLDIQENPDALNLESADVDLVYNTIQFNFNGQNQTMGFQTDGLMRLVNQFGTNTPGQGTMNGVWNQVYNTGTNLTALQTFAERDGFTYHYGAAQIMQATMYVNLVDFIGTAVFSEANNSLEFPNPGLDPGADIYASVMNLIDEGIANVQAGGRAPANDFYFGGDASGWVKYANTLKLRMWVQTRLVDQAGATAGISSLLAGGQLIDEVSEDLQFQYGTNTAPIESRHPLYTGNYINGAGGYMSNGLISYMKDSMSVSDPRLTYYFYRQTDRTSADLISNDLIPCTGSPQYDFCYVGDRYYARDHADNEGIPGDANLITTYGIYPAMGAYDDESFVAASATATSGNGIAPIMLSSWTHFMLAEAALTLGVNGGDATSLLETGVRQALEKVRSFSPSNMTAGQIDDYATEVLAEYAAATNDDQRLDIIIREWYLSSFTTGLLPFNNYRRTGYPSFLQDPVIAAGAFVRSYFLPESELNSNTNEDFAQQKSVTDQVFWDTNPAGFIN